MALTLTLDKPSYVPGDAGKLTVVDDSRAHVDTVTVTDTAGATGAASITLKDPIPTVRDTRGRVYALVSDDGRTTVYGFTA